MPIFDKMTVFSRAGPIQIVSVAPDFHDPTLHPLEITMAEIKRTRRNTLERRCLGKAFKRLFVKSPKGVFKMLEKIKRA